MLYTSVVTFCLVCSLHCFEPVQCRSTRHLNEYSNRSSLARRCLQSCLVISRHQTCFEKCLGKNNEGDFTDLNARILRINPPHLTPTFKRRKRSTEEGVIPCPSKAKGNNSFPTLRAPERNQYENSDKWYLNISWNSLPDSTNFTGYGIKYLCISDLVHKQVFLKMPKSETFKIFNESESCWSYDMDFFFILLGLPCLTYDDLIQYNELPWRRYPNKDVCDKYKILSTGDRAQGSVWQGNASCDWRLPPIALWYRFQDAAGYRIPDKCVPEKRCGTVAPGWMNGSHPTVTEGVVTREVCYHFSENCCYWSNNISVKNCGGYFVYKLKQEPYCMTRYCGNGGAVPEASVPPASVPPASVPPASVPPASVPPASVPPASVPPASVPPTSVPEGHGLMLALVIIFVLFLVKMGIAAVFVYRRWKKKIRRNGCNTPDEEVSMNPVTAEPTETIPHTSTIQVSFPWREIPRDRLTLGKLLGEGEFGMVVKGELTEDDGHITPCAVKKLKDRATESDLKDLKNELDIMDSVGHHPNLVNLIGACSSEGQLMIVVEFAEHGNLHRYLRDHRKQNYDDMNKYSLDISSAERLRIACDVAEGMKHIATMRWVHRDLAARNVLLGEGMVAKVADFGLTRDLYTTNVYEKKSGGKVPVKWLAVESLEEGLYTSQSDVWSFGVLLWEIETGGCTPYAGISTRRLLPHLKAEYRLDKPHYCSPELYSVMLGCWKANPKNRPTFEGLSNELHEMRTKVTEYLAPDEMEPSNDYLTVIL